MELGFSGAATPPTTTAAVTAAGPGPGGAAPVGAKGLFLQMLAGNLPAAEGPLATLPMPPIIYQPGAAVAAVLPLARATIEADAIATTPGDGEPGEPALDSVLTIPILGAPVATIPIPVPVPVTPPAMASAPAAAPTASVVASTSPALWSGAPKIDMPAPTPVSASAPIAPAAAQPGVMPPAAAPATPAIVSSDPVPPASATPAGAIVQPSVSPGPRPRVTGTARTAPTTGQTPRPGAATPPSSRDVATPTVLVPVASNLPADEGRAMPAPVAAQPAVTAADPAQPLAAPVDRPMVDVPVAGDSDVPQPQQSAPLPTGPAPDDRAIAGPPPAVTAAASPPPEPTVVASAEQPSLPMPEAAAEASVTATPSAPQPDSDSATGDRSARTVDTPPAPVSPREAVAMAARPDAPFPPVADRPAASLPDDAAPTDGDRFKPAIDASPAAPAQSLPLDTPARMDAPAALLVSSTPSASTVAGPSVAEAAVTHQLTMAQDGQWLDQLARDIARTAARDGELRFQLNPEHLGSLAVEMRQTADGTSLRFSADTEAARAIIADAQPRLIAEAKAQGVRIADAQVDLGGGRADTQGRQPQQQQQSQATGRNAEPQRQNRPSVTVETPSSATSERYA